jgi:hypothetical protein
MGGAGNVSISGFSTISSPITVSNGGGNGFRFRGLENFGDINGMEILGQNSSTVPTLLRMYNTYTDASNYERGGFDWKTTANVFRIRSENLGTGTNRIIAIDGFAKAGAAVAGDLPAGSWGLVHDTSGATTKLCYNDGGTLRTVALT